MIVNEEDLDAYLAHFGVKGMKWGVRKDDASGFRLQSGGPTIDASLHQSTQTSARKVASLMSDRYGFQITSIKDLKVNHPEEYAYGTVGFVKSTPGQSGGVVFAKPGDLRKDLKGAEDNGWFAEGTGNVSAFLTHEAGHALFHAEQSYKGIVRKKVVGGNIDARDKALAAATNQANRDGIPAHEQIARVSGYAAASHSREELEAELFSQYHWSPNPPPFVKAWGETLHQEMGLDPTPFRKVTKNG